MQVLDHNALLNRLERTLVRRQAVQITLLDPAAEEQHAAGVREMSVHAVVFFVVDHVRHFHLIFDFLVRFAFDQRVAAELTGQNDQRPVQQTALLQIEDELGHRRIDRLFHVRHFLVAVLVCVPVEKRDVFGGHLEVARADLGQQTTESKPADRCRFIAPGTIDRRVETSGRLVVGDVFADVLHRFQRQVEGLCRR